MSGRFLLDSNIVIAIFAGNDQLKANAVQIFKTKGVTGFKMA